MTTFWTGGGTSAAAAAPDAAAAAAAARGSGCVASGGHRDQPVPVQQRLVHAMRVLDAEDPQFAGPQMRQQVADAAVLAQAGGVGQVQHHRRAGKELGRGAQLFVQLGIEGRVRAVTIDAQDKRGQESTAH